MSPEPETFPNPLFTSAKKQALEVPPAVLEVIPMPRCARPAEVKCASSIKGRCWHWASFGLALNSQSYISGSPKFCGEDKARGAPFST